MKSTRRYLIPGLILTAGLTTVGQNAAASTKSGPTLTIHVINSAQVGHRTLIEAEKIVARIYGKAGIEIRWNDASLLTGRTKEDSVTKGPSDLSRIWLDILPQGLREPGIHKTATGLAPGSGPNRNLVYVFYDRIETMARQQMRVRLGGTYFRPATLSQILAYTVVHEIGHLLLNAEVHSAKGIMRGDWNLEDLHDIAYEKFDFTSQQVEVIRAEVSRRIAEHETVGVALR
jgi:hypothetical protein